MNVMRTKLMVSFQKKLHLCHYKESLHVKIVNSFLPIEMHYNWTFSKKAMI
jgi:hypothetical protein